MPLVAYALGAYIAGLYAGFSGVTLAAAAVLVAAVAVGARRSIAVAAGYAILAIAGVAVARARVRDDERCRAGVERSGTARIVLLDSAGPGGFARASSVECSLNIALSVESGTANAGARATARGVAMRSQRGVVIQHAELTAVRRAPLLAAARSRAGRAIDRTFAGDAPLVRALLIADRSGLSPEVRDRFAAAGLAHILAIAGLHIGFIVLALAMAFELCGLPRQRASIATIVIVVAYVAMIGAPIPAVRSATMLTVLFVTRLAQRPTSRWAIVALGASHAVLDPSIVLDVGYQLSVVGVASMIAAGLLGRRLALHRLGEIPRWIALTLLGTTVATIGSAAITAMAFGRLSLVAPLSNLAATPLIALAQPMLFFGLLTSPVPMVSRFVADAAHPLLWGLDRVATLASALPMGSVAVAPSILAASIAFVLSGAVIVACASRDWERPAAIALVATAALAWLPATSLARGEVEVHMIDVGQGDAIALRTSHGHWILFDAGGAWRGGDAGRSIVAPYIGRRGGPVDVFVLSHPHTDHVGGASSVFRALHPARFIDAGFPGPADAYRDALSTAGDQHIRWSRAHPGDHFHVDGVSLRILAPDSVWTSQLDDPNLASVVVLAEYGDVRMLFMGDAERGEEQWLLAHAASDLRADLLKVGHHGSKTSSSDEFLDAVRPRLALVSVGAGNVYHLPTPAIMEQLAARGAQVLRTDRLGTIVARTDGHRIHVAAAGDEWDLSVPAFTP
jgi:competence protein ComEC